MDLVCSLPVSDRTAFNPDCRVSEPQFLSPVLFCLPTTQTVSNTEFLFFQNISFCSLAFQEEPIFKTIFIKHLLKLVKETTFLQIIQAFQLASGGER